MIGIIGAMEEEVTILKRKLNDMNIGLIKKVKQLIKKHRIFKISLIG